MAQVQNGIKAPLTAAQRKDGKPGVCRMVWDLFASATGHIQPAHTVAISEKTGMNLENVRIELRRWKRFNGIPTGRVVH